MIDDTYTTLEEELDIANEWIWEFVLEDEPLQSKKTRIEKVLILSEDNGINIPNIEENIAITIQILIERPTEQLQMNKITLQEYESKVADITSDENRQRMLKDRMTPEECMLFEAGIAGAELLSAVLDKPTNSFSNFLQRTDDMYQEAEGFLFSDELNDFKKEFIAIIDKNEMLDLAIQVVTKINTKKNVGKLGLYGEDKKSYMACCDELITNLESLK